jgi:hypothetical protein
MGTFVTPAPEAACPEQGGRYRSLDELQQELSADPCRFLRRACQVADYDTTSAATLPTEPPRAPQ